MKLLATVIALNLAIVGTGVWFANAAPEHELVQFEQVVDSPFQSILGLENVETKYPETIKSIQDKLAKHKVRAENEAEQKALAEAEAEKAAAETKHTEWLSNGQYICNEYESTVYPDNSATKWKKTGSQTTLLWKQSVPNAIEMVGDYSAFKVDGMQGAETSYFKETKNHLGTDVEYELDMSETKDNILNVFKRTYLSNSQKLNLWICK